MRLVVVPLLFLVACTQIVVPDVGDPVASPSPVLTDTVLPYVGEGTRCSAVALEDHLAVTARHCLRSIGAGMLVRERRPVMVTDAWASPDGDIALLHTEQALGLHAPVSQNLPHLGDPAYVAGFGCDSTSEHMRLGVRAGVYVGRDSQGKFWFSGVACHGDSGGGTFDRNGALIGVSTNIDTDDGPVSAWAAVPLFLALDGLESGRGWKPGNEFLVQD